VTFGTALIHPRRLPSGSEATRIGAGGAEGGTSGRQRGIRRGPCTSARAPQSSGPCMWITRNFGRRPLASFFAICAARRRFQLFEFARLLARTRICGRGARARASVLFSRANRDRAALAGGSVYGGGGTATFGALRALGISERYVVAELYGGLTCHFRSRSRPGGALRAASMCRWLVGVLHAALVWAPRGICRRGARGMANRPFLGVVGGVCRRATCGLARCGVTDRRSLLCCVERPR